MARVRSASRWRWIHPSYYLKRPKRLALLFIAFVLVSFGFWDRQTLVREHEEEVSMLNSKLSELRSQVRELKAYLGDVGEDIVGNLSKSSEKITIPDDPIDVERREKVKEAMLHAWNSYVKYAWGQDELQPQTRNGVNSFGGLGATLVDSLDTLHIMGLHDEFQKAREWVANSLNFNKDYEASVFETTIRVVGGLLSAYDLSGDKIFLEKAQDIADRLLPAWDTPSGIPYNVINLAHGNAHNFGWTGVERVITQIQKTYPSDGLLPIFINSHSGTPSYRSTITFGAMGDSGYFLMLSMYRGHCDLSDMILQAATDLKELLCCSFYEYLLKVWVQGNKTESVKHYREMWETSMQGLLSLVRKTTPSSFTYICEKNGDSLSDKMDELACFVPGMLALGSFGYSPENAEKFMSLAKELAWTCYNFYQSTPTKLAGENYFFNSGEDMSVGTSWNILRPETVESLMYLWRFTGNKTYQEWGWNIFQAFEKNSRIDSGYVGLKDVNTGAKDNKMQTFFLAETLKYLYLLFSPPSVISFDEWVFNTEAHPLRIVPRNGKTVAEADTKLKPKPPSRFLGRKQGHE
ncbi:hypothetical protein Taro_000383 [Colocasia esculenta]|uniref:alpha-1,2-Mannosidase n=1 Tax=Colocasia esculenta TaxID=4460 RepID=A0A843TF68_COLES|nr:hypothetical protein [Colocasia esculenta]